MFARVSRATVALALALAGLGGCAWLGEDPPPIALETLAEDPTSWVGEPVRLSGRLQVDLAGAICTKTDCNFPDDAQPGDRQFCDTCTSKGLLVSDDGSHAISLRQVWCFGRAVVTYRGEDRPPDRELTFEAVSWQDNPLTFGREYEIAGILRLQAVVQDDGDDDPLDGYVLEVSALEPVNPAPETPASEGAEPDAPAPEAP